MQNLKNIFDFKKDEDGKTYISSFDNERKIEVNLFFDESDYTNVMREILQFMSKIYIEDILKR